jgi:hypothetical protein
MPALPADIGAATRPARIETWSNAAIKSRYPNARDGEGAPAEGMFDLAADAAAALAQRAALIGVERRRLTAVAGEIVWPDPLSGVPSVAATDPEQNVAGTFLAAKIELSLEDETTTYELFG